MKILIVEDENIIRKEIKKLIERRLEYKVFEASNGIEALEVLERENVDLLITDMRMPKMNGFQFIDMVKSNLKTKDLPIIITSAFSQDLIKRGVSGSSVEKILTKPVEPTVLIEVIKDILNSKKLSIKFNSSNKFVKSFVEFYSSENIAIRMLSILEALSYKIAIKDEDKIKMEYALDILSIIIKSNLPKKTINFCMNMGVDFEIISLIESIKSPESEIEEIIYLIYKFIKAKYENKRIEDVTLKAKVDEHLKKLIEDIIKDNIIVVNSSLDYEIVLDKLVNIILNDKNISFDNANSYISICKDILKYRIDNKKETIIKILDTPYSIEFVFSVDNCNLDKVDEFISDNLIKDINIKIEEREGIKTFIALLQKDLKEKQVIEDDKRTLLLKTTTLNSEISAKSYIESLGIDISEDVEELKELEEEWVNSILNFNYSSIESLHSIADDILKYGNKIDNIFYEFKPIGFALIELANKLFDLRDYGHLNDSDIRKLIHLLELLREDLSNWREIVFIEQNTNNVHYLDTSLLSSCTQIEQILTNEEISDEDGDVMFF